MIAGRCEAALPLVLRRSAPIAAMLLAASAGSGIPGTAHAQGSSWWLVPAIQIGGHIETGGGVLSGSGLDAREQGGGVAAAFSLLAAAGPRLHAGIAIELTGARAAVEQPNAVQPELGQQAYGVASVRTMARAELRSRHPADPRDRGGGFYLLAGAGWNFNAVGTKITYLAGAPAGYSEDLHIGGSPAFELGGGLELARKPDGEFIIEANWVYNASPYRLQISGEPDRTGTSNLSGVTVLIGLRLHPVFPPREPD